MFTITIHPTGDRAEAEDEESAVYAARVLLREAYESGCGRPTATFYAPDGSLVRANVPLRGC